MVADQPLNYTNLTIVVPPRKQPLQPSFWQLCFPSTDKKPVALTPEQRARIAQRLPWEPETAQPSRVDTVQSD